VRRTSGGKDGETVVVSTLEALESAVAGNDSRIVVVSGTISGAKKIFVGSNKSIIGRNGSESHSSCEFERHLTVQKSSVSVSRS